MRFLAQHLRKGALLLAAVGSVMQPFPAAAEDKAALVKAAFLYNFLKFVQWPGDRAVNARTSVDICILGSNPFDGAATAIMKEASTSARKLNFVEEKSPQEAAKHCHIVYIPGAEEARAAEITAALRDLPVLTVSDGEEFAQKHGMIGFVLVEGKIKLAVNLPALTAAGLKADAQMLEIAHKVIK